MPKIKTYIVGVPFMVNAYNKKAAQKTAQDAMVKLGQFSPDAAKHIIPLKNVFTEDRDTITIRAT